MLKKIKMNIVTQMEIKMLIQIKNKINMLKTIKMDILTQMKKKLLTKIAKNSNCSPLSILFISLSQLTEMLRIGKVKHLHNLMNSQRDGIPLLIVQLKVIYYDQIYCIKHLQDQSLSKAQGTQDLVLLSKRILEKSAVDSFQLMTDN